MSAPASPHHFDAQQAAGYDDRWAALAPLRDSLHLQMRLVLQGLPVDACILCVGAGTGTELIALARFFPSWRFVAVDPSAAMLDLCKRNTDREGITGRCEFHACFVHELPTDLRCDAATAILVSQFITEKTQRSAFFRDIAKCLKPAGALITADLCLLPDDQQKQLFPIWQRMMMLTGATEEQVQGMLASYRQSVALLPLGEMESLLQEAGFLQPVHFSQSLLIHAWFARR